MKELPLQGKRFSLNSYLISMKKHIFQYRMRASVPRNLAQFDYKEYFPKMYPWLQLPRFFTDSSSGVFFATLGIDDNVRVRRF